MSQPYHLTLVSLLNRPGLTASNLSLLGLLIESTKLPHNHDNVLVAWEAAHTKMYFGDAFDEEYTERFDEVAGKDPYRRVVMYIVAEKERVAKEATEKAAAIQSQSLTNLPKIHTLLCRSTNEIERDELFVEEKQESAMSQPYHESLVPLLNLAVVTASNLSVLGFLIESTELPHNHDNVLAAWTAAHKKIHKERFDEVAGEDLYCRVVAHIAAEKTKAEAKAKEKAEEIRPPPPRSN